MLCSNLDVQECAVLEIRCGELLEPHCQADTNRIAGPLLPRLVFASLLQMFPQARKWIASELCIILSKTSANSCSDVDHGMFVLNVDLWSADGNKEVNLVRHSATSPSISCTTPVSYANIDQTTSMAYSSILPTSQPIKFEGGHQQAPYNPYPGQPSVTPYAGNQQSQQYGGQPQYQGYAPPTNGTQQYPPQNGYSQGQPQPAYYTTGSGIHAIGQQGIDFPPPQQQLPSHNQYAPARQFSGSEIPMHRVPVSSTAPQGMFTRNLIGSLAASAFRLTDPDDRIGIWFVLQDLSVRTEGTFRYLPLLSNRAQRAPWLPLSTLSC